jgi:CheY-like chemotaxis protein
MDAARPEPRAVEQVGPNGKVAARLLLAEDHPINRRIAIAQLKELGMEADVATNGQEAIDAYKRNRYDIILMDCQMPEVDGFDATRAIRAMQARDGGDVRIIAMTANAMEGDRKACTEAGMDDYLSKPVSLDQLREMLLPVVALTGDLTGGHEGTSSPIARVVLDSERLSQIFQDDAEAIRELLELSISECEPLATAMKTAVAEKETSAAMQAAHKFKGICGNVGANELASIGLRIERAARSADWESAQDGCTDLDAGLGRFVAAATAAQSNTKQTANRKAI